MIDDRDIVERLEDECSKIAFDDQVLMREAAALIRTLDEAVDTLVGGASFVHQSIAPTVNAAIARHAARVKRSAGNE